MSQRLGEEGNLTALEAEAERISEGQEALRDAALASPVRLVVGNVFEPPFGPQTFDLVYSAGLFHELDVRERPAEDALRSLISVVRPGGRVATSDFIDAVPAVQLADEEIQRELALEASGARLYGIGSPERLVGLHESLLEDVRWRVSLPYEVRHLDELVLAEESRRSCRTCPPARSQSYASAAMLYSSTYGARVTRGLRLCMSRDGRPVVDGRKSSNWVMRRSSERRHHGSNEDESETRMTLIQLRSVEKFYGGRAVLRGLEMKVNPGARLEAGRRQRRGQVHGAAYPRGAGGSGRGRGDPAPGSERRLSPPARRGRRSHAARGGPRGAPELAEVRGEIADCEARLGARGGGRPAKDAALAGAPRTAIAAFHRAGRTGLRGRGARLPAVAGAGWG